MAQPRLNRAPSERAGSQPLTASKVLMAALKEADEVKQRHNLRHQSAKRVSIRQEADTENSALRKELSEERREHETTRNLLEAARDELRTASYFFDQADPISYSQVIQSVQDLNHHAFELAARLSDALAISKWSKETGRQLPGKLQAAQVEMTSSKIVGKDFFATLNRLSSHKESSSYRIILLQYAIQSWVVVFSCNLLERSRWSSDQSEERVLEQLYERLTHGDDRQRAFAGRWRTLTREVCQTTPPDENRLTLEIMSGLRSIMSALGFGITKDDAISFLSDFRDSILSVVESLLKVDRATKEQISTADIHPVIGSPGTRYPSIFLEDGNSGTCRPSPAAKNDHVLVSIGLGLTITKHSDASSERECLLKSKVILRSTFDI